MPTPQHVPQSNFASCTKELFCFTLSRYCHRLYSPSLPAQPSGSFYVSLVSFLSPFLHQIVFSIRAQTTNLVSFFAAYLHLCAERERERAISPPFPSCGYWYKRSIMGVACLILFFVLQFLQFHFKSVACVPNSC